MGRFSDLIGAGSAPEPTPAPKATKKVAKPAPKAQPKAVEKPAAKVEDSSKWVDRQRSVY